MLSPPASGFLVTAFDNDHHITLATFLSHHTLYLTTKTVSASRGASLIWLVSVISQTPSPLLPKILSRLWHICLLGHPSYLALYLENIDPDDLINLSVESFWLLSILSMILELCASSHAPRHPQSATGHKQPYRKSYHRIHRNAPVALESVSQTLILRQELYMNRCYRLLKTM
jgi:hypothetical protein